MKPCWFDIPKEGTDYNLLRTSLLQQQQQQTQEDVIPLHKMWIDDPFWLPLLIAGNHFVGRVDLDSTVIPPGHDKPHSSNLLRWWFATVERS